MKIGKIIKRFFQRTEARKAEFAKEAATFIDRNPDAFVLLADADTDVIVMAYKGVMVPVRLTQPDGSRMHIVKNALDYSKKEKAVDQLLLIVDSGLVNIAKMRDTGGSKRSRVTGLVEAPIEKTPEGITAPYQHPLKAT